jgi:hypothetical protein
MARESSLWQRCKTGIRHLAALGHKVHFCRVENAAGEGHPDVEGVVNGAQCWIELKSCDRPKRHTTVIRPKTRESQSIWHAQRAAAGCRMHWVLIQVGEASKAKLYLIPGHRYDKITCTEDDLLLMSHVPEDAFLADVLLEAAKGW